MLIELLILYNTGYSANDASVKKDINFLKSMVRMLEENAQEGEQQPETLKGQFLEIGFILKVNDVIFRFFERKRENQVVA